MSQWKQNFVKRVDTLREAAIKKFETFADGALASVYEEYSEFTSQHEFHCSSPQHQQGSRFYKFALSEDAYVLLYFRARGIDGVECEHECSAPGQGCSESERTSVPSAEAVKNWVERCFQTALDDLLGRVAQSCSVEAAPELVASLAD
jgi:hypothetical protein